VFPAVRHWPTGEGFDVEEFVVRIGHTVACDKSNDFPWQLAKLPSTLTLSNFHSHRCQSMSDQKLSSADDQTQTAPPAPSLLTRTITHNQSSEPHVLPDAPPGYELLEELGRGGMGVVYRARQVSLNREVALKVVLAGGHASSAQRQRFLREAEAVAAINHQNVVQVYDFGEHAGLPFMSLELCEAGTLAARLAGTPLPSAEAASLVETLAYAVQKAHEHGIIHRDLKPANVLLTNDGNAKVADFGLAKISDSTPGFTATGAIFGTPSYMAPEQARGDRNSVGPSTDVYSLGAILYECLTGRPPFKGASSAETIVQVLHQNPVSIRDLNPGVPTDLDTICLKCLEKDPSSRYASARSLADDLRAFLESRPVHARPVSSLGRLNRWRKRNPGLSTAVFASMAILFVGTAVSLVFGIQSIKSAKDAALATERAERESDKAREEVIKSQRLLARMSSNDGVRLADAGQLHFGLLKMAEPLRIAPESPDAVATVRVQFNVFRRYSENQLRLTGVFHHKEAINSAEFSADGRLVVTASDDKTARVWSVETGVALTPPLPHESRVDFAEFSPDSERVLTASGAQATIWETRTGRQLIPSIALPQQASTATFVAGGKRFLVITGKTCSVFDSSTGQRIFAALEHKDAIYAFDIDKNGTTLATASEDKSVRLWDFTTGHELVPPLLHKYGANHCQLNPDGTTIITGAGATARLWDARTGKPITDWLKEDTNGNERGQLGAVRFSPDGSRILIAFNIRSRLYDGRSGVPLTPFLENVSAKIGGGGTISEAFFALNGQYFLTKGGGFVQLRDGRDGHAVGDPIPSRNDGINSISPDGRFIAVSDSDSDNSVRVLDLETHQPVSQAINTPEELENVVFSPQGRHLLVQSGSSVRVWDFAVSRSGERGNQIATNLQDASFNADGTRLAMVSDATNVAVCLNTTTRLVEPLKFRHENYIWEVKFNRSGDRLVTASADKTAKIWDSHTGQLIAQPLVHNSGVILAEFSPDGKYVVTATAESMAHIWDVDTGKMLGSPMPHRGRVSSAKFSPDSKYLVTGCYDNTGRVWEVSTCRPVTPYLRHNNSVTAVAFAPEGRRVATVGSDNTCRIWDALTGKLACSIPIQSGNGRDVAFSSDGRRIATAFGESARIWNADSGDPLTPGLAHSGRNLKSLGFRENGNQLIAVTGGEEAFWWDLTPDERPAEDILAFAELLSSHRLNDSGTRTPLDHETLRSHWETLRTKYPSEFKCATETAKEWRLQQIRDCMTHQNVLAADFHYWWLVVEAARAGK
jgi:eukaryotic-like serine/threonine-protein kinase